MVMFLEKTVIVNFVTGIMRWCGRQSHAACTREKTNQKVAYMVFSIFLKMG